MKLQLALIFGEHMVLQRGEPIPIWGRSARDDTVTVTLGDSRQTVQAAGGKWKAVMPPMPTVERIALTVSSALTGEQIAFRDVAIGEVWLAGGQSNMEFQLKYDELAEEMYQTAPDLNLRFFRYPQASYTGCLEKDAYPDDGFWRTWSSREDRGMFSAVAAYMGRKLREALGVPVGFVGVNWGATTAAAWTALEDIRANPALRPVLDWHEAGCKNLDLAEYYAASDLPAREPSFEERRRSDELMMGIGLEKLFAESAAPALPPQAAYTPDMIGPRCFIRPAGLYDSMLKNVAPYGVRGVIWYQGESDDLLGWQDFYEESMKTLIGSWRKLWGKELPFLQVELAPYSGYGTIGAKRYDVIREKQRLAAEALPGVHNVCIMDSGDFMNIHVRKKKPVGDRLSLLARKYVYGEASILADSPRYESAVREGGTIKIRFSNAGDGLLLDGDIQKVLLVTVGSKDVTPSVSVAGNTLILDSESFLDGTPVRIKFAKSNYCDVPIFNSAKLPAFPFAIEIY